MNNYRFVSRGGKVRYWNQNFKVLLWYNTGFKTLFLIKIICWAISLNNTQTFFLIIFETRIVRIRDGWLVAALARLLSLGNLNRVADKCRVKLQQKNLRFRRRARISQSNTPKQHGQSKQHEKQRVRVINANKAWYAVMSHRSRTHHSRHTTLLNPFTSVTF